MSQHSWRAPWLLIFSLVVFRIAGASSSEHFVFMSDLHYDKEYGTMNAAQTQCSTSSAPLLGSYGCDSSWGLIQSAIHDALGNHTFLGEEKQHPPEYVLMTGDWLRHRMSSSMKQLGVQSFSQISSLFQNFSGHVFPAPNVVTALGNDDFIPDYYFQYESTVQVLLSDILSTFQMHNILTSVEEGQTFARCGYYSRSVSNKLNVIVLNTLVWTVMMSPSMANPNSDPCEQFQFLEGTLQKAKSQGKSVYVISHIPPTINIYPVVSRGLAFNSSDAIYWQPAFESRFSSILAQYNDIVKAQLYGHTHKFSFIGDGEIGVPLFIVPSIAPVFGNNPSYLLAEIDSETQEILRLQQRSFNMSTNNRREGVWYDAGPTINAQLFNDQSPLTASVLSQTGIRFASSDSNNLALFDSFLKIYEGGVSIPPFGKHGHCDESCRRLFACATQSSNSSFVFYTCFPGTSFPTTTAPPTGSSAIGMNTSLFIASVSVLCIGVVSLFGLYCWSRRKTAGGLDNSSSAQQEEGYNGDQFGLVSGTAKSTFSSGQVQLSSGHRPLDGDDNSMQSIHQ